MGLVANRTGLRAALESTNGSVTDFLEQLVGERVDARAQHHRMVVARTSNQLGAEMGEPLLERSATLCGRVSGAPYVYAESVMATSRLPTSFCLRLESSNDPIGRILDEMGIATSRTNVVETNGLAASRASGEIKVADSLLVRTYRIDSAQNPLMVITEWFLKTLIPFL